MHLDASIKFARISPHDQRGLHARHGDTFKVILLVAATLARELCH